MIFDTKPPSVSMPSDSGVTSSRSISRFPVTRMSAWTAAPRATTSSGFNSLCGVRPNSSLTTRHTSGIRVDPPTSTTSSICAAASPASTSAWRHGPRAHARRSDGSMVLELGAGDPLAIACPQDAKPFATSRAPPCPAPRASATTISVSSLSERSHFAWMTTGLRTACTGSGQSRTRRGSERPGRAGASGIPAGRVRESRFRAGWTPCEAPDSRSWPAPAPSATDRSRRRRGACRHWSPAPETRRPRHGGSRCRTCRPPDRTRQSGPCGACSSHRRARRRSAR